MTKIEQIKKLLFGDVPPTPAPVAPVSLGTDYTLQDGSAVTVDKLDIGGKVTVAGVPATEGNYTLQDGTTFSVDANGMITEINAPAPADAAAAPTPIDYSTQFTELEAKIKALKDQFENDLKTATGKMAAQELIIKELFSVVEEMAALPAGNPAEQVPHKFSKEQEKEQRLRTLQENLKKIKNL